MIFQDSLVNDKVLYFKINIHLESPFKYPPVGLKGFNMLLVVLFELIHMRLHTYATKPTLYFPAKMYPLT